MTSDKAQPLAAEEPQQVDDFVEPLQLVQPANGPPSDDLSIDELRMQFAAEVHVLRIAFAALDAAEPGSWDSEDVTATLRRLQRDSPSHVRHMFEPVLHSTDRRKFVDFWLGQRPELRGPMRGTYTQHRENGGKSNAVRRLSQARIHKPIMARHDREDVALSPLGAPMSDDEAAEVAPTSQQSLDHALALLFLRLGPPPQPTGHDYEPASSGDGGAWK